MLPVFAHACARKPSFLATQPYPASHHLTPQFPTTHQILRPYRFAGPSKGLASPLEVAADLSVQLT
eukprot:9647173-Alexandrium_andersonii.AAC.1